MLLGGILALVNILCLIQNQGAFASDDDFYRAVVVEYSPVMDDSVDGKTNLMNNVHEYVNIVKEANEQFLVDIIVFPEIGLKGYHNQRYAVEVPNPADRIVPCAHDTKYEAPIVQLSCTANAYGVYLIVNLEESAFDAHAKTNVSFNTDVVFGPDGAIVARYRKANLFNEGNLTPGPKELVYFDTDFGVRFGLFTCFDIIFEVPAVELARTLNITHFVFPTAWFSELPFLTAVQEQWYWSYTLDVVLLGSNYNLPSVGSTGSGIFVGRKGPAAYNMTESRGTFMIYAKIPKNFRAAGSSVENLSVKTTDLIPVKDKGQSSAKSGFLIKRDNVDVYETEMISIPANASEHFDGDRLVVPFNMEKRICSGALCCNFSIQVTAKFAAATPPASRGDDFSQNYFRLAAFDGVRPYEHAATGGVQTCAVLACAGRGLAACGLRADDPAAETARFRYLYQTEFIFESIAISGNFSSNNTFVGPDILLKGEGDDFGSLASGKDVYFNDGRDTGVRTLRSASPVEGLVTFALYGRAFDRDGQAATGSDTGKGGCSADFDSIFNLILTAAALILIKIKMS